MGTSSGTRFPHIKADSFGCRGFCMCRGLAGSVREGCQCYEYIYKPYMVAGIWWRQHNRFSYYNSQLGLCFRQDPSLNFGGSCGVGKGGWDLTPAVGATQTLEFAIVQLCEF